MLSHVTLSSCSFTFLSHILARINIIHTVHNNDGTLSTGTNESQFSKEIMLKQFIKIHIKILMRSVRLFTFFVKQTDRYTCNRLQ